MLLKSLMKQRRLKKQRKNNMEKSAKELNTALKTISDYCTGRDCDECLIGRNRGECRLVLRTPYDWTEIEPKPILTPEEHDYLKKVITPKYGFVKSICKHSVFAINIEYIIIRLNDNTEATLFPSDIGDEYKGMKNNYDYTLEELGL